MKIALIGDVHGNEYALVAALKAASKLNVEKYLVTGDLVGYYFSPARVLELLKPFDFVAVRGNHEDMLFQARNDSQFLQKIDDRYGPGIRIALDQLTETQVQTLCDLPHPLELSIDGVKILLCHGSPSDNSEYIYPDTEDTTFNIIDYHKFDLVVLGHTHYQMKRSVGKTLVVNPGSVGQPRNHEPGAQWCLLDTLDLSIHFFNEQYDMSPLLLECDEHAPNHSYLKNVLVREKSSKG